ncbi:MAG TPA: PEP-CTERM sorting domain-containing protein [Chthoniobacteraceae bacterium]|jgi:sugar lactone lactonase YvrE|nr:PEP-CTERM sorting domain-containing protein [Chthoniobacteraceae bacterium]
MRLSTLFFPWLTLACSAAWAAPVYFTDPITNVIYSYDSVTLQGGLFASIELVNPVNGIACDKFGNVYASARNFIYRFTPDGVRTTYFTGTTQYFEDLVVDLSGNIYAYSGKVYKITPAGAISVIATGFMDGQAPLACDSAGNVFVGDGVAGNVTRITPGGAKSSFSTGLQAGGLAVDAAGNVYVADRGNGDLKEYSQTGTLINSSTFPANPFSNPTGIAFDVQGQLYGHAPGAEIDRLDAAFHRSLFIKVPNASDPVGDIAIAPIPEPAAALLLCSGLAALALRRGRSRPRWPHNFPVPPLPASPQSQP